MARMFGFIGNRADLGGRIVSLNAEVLRVARGELEAVGWGIGFYQSGEVLLRRRPIDDRSVIDLGEATESVRTDVLMGHVRTPRVGPLSTENTQPFRYRMWLFAQTGTINGFDKLRARLVESQPEFLRRNVRGETDCELFFYLFLSFLHDAGHLDEPSVRPEHVRAALRATISLVDRLSAEEGFPQNEGNILVTNGEHMVCVHRSGTTAFRVFKGRSDVEQLLGEQETLRLRIPSLETSQFSIIASELDDVPHHWIAVEGRSMVTLRRAEDPALEAL